MTHENFKSSNVLVLGGLGFIGSNLAIRLEQLGANVTLVDSMLPQYGGNLANIDSIQDKVKVNYSDIRDRHSLDYLVRGSDIIYSLAGQTSHIDSMTDPFVDLEINCTSQLAVLESCRNHNPEARVIYASTRQVYGRPKYLPVDEKHPLLPVDVNGINKLAAENYYSLYSRVHGIKCVSLRLTNSYGPRQHLRGNTQGFVGIFLRKAISGEKIQVFGDGTQLRDFNYVDDVVEALLLSAEEESLSGGVFNLGASKYYSIRDFLDILRQYCEFEFEIVPFPPEHKAIDIGDYYSDYNLFRKHTGWEPKVELEEGLKLTVDYFKPKAASYW